jgi:hypothetical protein
MKEYGAVKPISWRYCVYDEVFKNRANSKLHELVPRLKTEHLTFLTTSPVEEKTEEFWPFLHTMEPQKYK